MENSIRTSAKDAGTEAEKLVIINQQKKIIKELNNEVVKLQYKLNNGEKWYRNPIAIIYIAISLLLIILK